MTTYLQEEKKNPKGYAPGWIARSKLTDTAAKKLLRQKKIKFADILDASVSERWHQNMDGPNNSPSNWVKIGVMTIKIRDIKGGVKVVRVDFRGTLKSPKLLEG